VAVFLAILLPPGLAQQAPPRTAVLPPEFGTGAISGRVFDASVGAPLPGAQVDLSGQSTLNVRRVTTTDLSGAFVFDRLPPGDYILGASRAGYLTINHGQTRPGAYRPGAPVTLAAGRHLPNIDIGLPRGNAITGRVVDELGIAATGSIVRIYRRVIQDAGHVLQVAGSGAVDDRGIYRVFGLLPGTYVVGVMGGPVQGGARFAGVEAMVDDGGKVVGVQAGPLRLSSPDRQEAGRATVFYPNTASVADAERIVLGVAEERSGVDLLMRTVPLATIEGSIVPMEGAPTFLTLYLQDPSSMLSVEGHSMQSVSGGEFRFSNVQPGHYTVLARASARRTAAADRSEWTELWWGRADVTVSGQRLTNLSLTIQSGQTVSGQVVFAGSPQPSADAIKQGRVTLRPVGQPGTTATIVQAPVNEHGGFIATGLMPGRYLVRASAGPSYAAWLLSSATVGGRETLDDLLEVPEGRNVTGLQLTFSQRSAELSGALTDAAGKPVQGYTIVAFTTDRGYWTPHSRRIAAAVTGADGRYRLRGLPPGDYHLVALLDPEPESWRDADILRDLVRASVPPIGLNEGAARTQDLRIGG
jgi:protocatechuate 3,4-dioxygenase beta subunit